MTSQQLLVTQPASFVTCAYSHHTNKNRTIRKVLYYLSVTL